MNDEYVGGMVMGFTIAIFFALYLISKERERAERPKWNLERNDENRRVRKQRQNGIRQEPPGPYLIQFRDGRREHAETWDKVEAIMRAAYPDMVIGHAADLADHGPHTLVWRNAIDDMSEDYLSRAVAMVTLATSAPPPFPPRSASILGHRTRR